MYVMICLNKNLPAHESGNDNKIRVTALCMWRPLEGLDLWRRVKLKMHVTAAFCEQVEDVQLFGHAKILNHMLLF